MNLRLVHKVLIFAITLVMGVALYLFSVRSTPVLYRWVEDTPPIRYPVFTLFNPFRDRQPERSAESFLNLFKSGKCEQAIAGLPVDVREREKDTCGDLESEHPTIGWTVYDRVDKGDIIETYYWVTYKGINHPAQRQITVRKINDQWQVVNYAIEY